MLISLLWWCIMIIIINNNHHHYHHHHHCSSLLTPALRVWFPSLPALTSVSARAYFLQPFLLLDLNLIIIECRCLAVGLKLACSKHFFFSSPFSLLSGIQRKHRSSRCTVWAVTFHSTRLFKSGFLCVHFWQDLPQRHRTWSTTSTRLLSAWSGTHRLTREAAMMSATGLYAEVVAGSLRSALRVGQTLDTLPRSLD